MVMKIEMVPSYRIVYIRHTGPYGTGNVQTMERMKAWAKAHHLMDDSSIILGIAQDDPQETSPEDCRYDACLVIFDEYRVDDGTVDQATLAGGKYAVFEIDHTAQAVEIAWRDIGPKLAAHELLMDKARPVIERYAAAMIRNHRCEICVPVC